jgi:hypothetical protein
MAIVKTTRERLTSKAQMTKKGMEMVKKMCEQNENMKKRSKKPKRNQN